MEKVISDLIIAARTIRPDLWAKMDELDQGGCCELTILDICNDEFSWYTDEQIKVDYGLFILEGRK